MSGGLLARLRFWSPPKRDEAVAEAPAERVEAPAAPVPAEPPGGADAPAERRTVSTPLPDRPLAVARMRADGPPADVAADEPPGELYFFSRFGTRKLRGYPAAWAALPRAGLEALCARAQTIGDAGAAIMAS